MEERNGSLTGLTEDEAKEFHDIFVKSFMMFTAIAVFAHILVWMWRPWLGAGDSAGDAAQSLQTILPSIAPFVA